MKHLIIIILIIFNTSCNSQKKPDIIKIDINQERIDGSFNEYFSSSSVIPLETNESSLFSSIDRLSLFDDKIFILDKSLNGVFIFNKTGMFLYKIQNVGRGPQEYNSLMDFTIDKINKQIILYTDRPYKLFFYNIEGEFIKEKKMNELYYNIAHLNNKILLRNNDVERKYMFFEYDLNTEKEKGFVQANEKDEFFRYFAISNPYIITSKDVYATFPYSDVIYTYNGNNIIPKYYIDFGDRKMPDKVYNIEKNLNGVAKYARENNYGWGITSFRENKNFITFKYHLGKLVIYSKKTKTAKSFINFEKDKVDFVNYLAHDGDDNKLISFYYAESFKKRMDYLKKEGTWEEVPTHIKEINNKVSKYDNPLLIIYTFKE